MPPEDPARPLASPARPTTPEVDCSYLLGPGELKEMIDRVRPYTVLSEANLRELGQQVCAALAQGIPGDFVECGVFRGGACFLVAQILRRFDVRDRRVWLMDSFEGMPPPSDLDGPTAQRALADWASKHAENLAASLEDVEQAARQLGVLPLTRFAKGWFNQTLPALRNDIGDIAILRIDADWYDSVRCCLDNLYDQVSAGGIVIIDDYFMEGCALAVHEFLGGQHIRFRLETTSEFEPHRIAYLRKGAATWQQSWARLTDLRLRHAAARLIASAVPEGATYVLVDDERWDRHTLVPNRRPLPFLERDGVYWGNPPDDRTAVQEIERMREAGAEFVMFAQPSFWWLEHYRELRRHLESRYARVLDDDAVIGFKL